MKLKRILIIFLLSVAALSAALIVSPHFIRQAITRSIQDAVPESTVTLGSCRFVRGNHLVLGDMGISLKTPSKNFPKLQVPESNGGFLPLLLASVSVRDLRFDIQTRDLSMNGALSFTRNLRSETFESLSLDLSSLALGLATAKEIRASSDAPGTGDFSVGSLLFSKFKVENLRGLFQVSDAGVLLEKMNARFLDGTVKGRLTLTRLGTLPVCTAELDLTDIPVASFLKLWEWEKKVAANGKLRGHLIAEISGGKLTRLDGAMLATADGNFVILDQAFLENIAARAKQPIEIVRASFEDYHYNTGTVGVSLEENKLRLRLDLEGEKGKRDLEVTLHDWF